MVKRVLFVVEGKSEKKTICELFKKVLKHYGTEISVYVYETTVYDLYKLITNHKNKYSSFLSVLWEKDKNQFPKDIIKPNDAFSAVYLIFDFDPQATHFDIKICEDLSKRFDDETRDGKIYFNYPMLESYMHVTSFKQDVYNKKTIKYRNCFGRIYKKIALNETILARINGDKNGNKPNINNLTGNVIHSIIKLNMVKYNYLTNNSNLRWQNSSEQKRIISKQKELSEDELVSIINTSLLIIPDYSPELLEKIKTNCFDDNQKE